MHREPAASEQALATKLLRTLHLSVPERAALPDGTARFSVLVAAVREALAGSPWFPRPLDPTSPFDGAILEAKPDGSYVVHTQHEAGVNRYSPIRSKRTRGLEQAVRTYTQHAAGETIDGIPIDWQS